MSPNERPRTVRGSGANEKRGERLSRASVRHAGDVPAYDGPPPEWLAAHPVGRRAWLAGYQRGVQDGVDLGRAQANQEWTAATSAAARAGLALAARAEAEGRRDRYAREPLTAAQIMRRARASWDALEAELAARERRARLEAVTT